MLQWRALGPERIFHDSDFSLRVDKGQIEPCFGQLPLGLTAQKFGRSCENTQDLALPKAGARRIEAAAFLDLDEDHIIAIGQHKVDFAALTPVAAVQQTVALGAIVAQDAVFRSQSGQMIARLPHSAFPFSNAA